MAQPCRQCGPLVQNTRLETPHHDVIGTRFVQRLLVANRALGRFWIGTIDETRVTRNAALYSLDCRAGRTPLVECKLDPSTLPATTANGLAWSPDGRTLYWADTTSHAVYAWDYALHSNSMTARPWTCTATTMWPCSRGVEFATPAQCPTMPCFGGADLQTLYLTSARHQRSAAELQAFPLSGCVFSMRVEVPGLPVNFFAD